MNFEFPIDMLWAYSLLVKADVVCHESNVNSFTSQTVKSMLYLGNFLLHFVLICNLEVSLKFQLTFLQVNVIKMYTVR